MATKKKTKTKSETKVKTKDKAPCDCGVPQRADIQIVGGGPQNAILKCDKCGAAKMVVFKTERPSVEIEEARW